MIIIEVIEKNIDYALRTFKKKLDKTKVIRNYRKKGEFVKKSEKRRAEIKKAKYLEKKINEIN
jgi:small subunit ribosomal protein S21